MYDFLFFEVSMSLSSCVSLKKWESYFTHNIKYITRGKCNFVSCILIKKLNEIGFFFPTLIILQ